MNDSPPTLWAALRLAWNLGYIIAIPAVGFGFGGAYLDRAQGTSPLFLILGFIVAFTLSTTWVLRVLKAAQPPNGSN